MKIKELSTEQESQLEQNLVWIFASRRSGTTWLGKELLSHETRFLDEPLIGIHLGRYEMSKTGLVRTFDVQKDRKDYFFSDVFGDSWKFYLRKLILNRIYSQFQDLTHKIIIKEPTGSIASDILAQCMPNSKIIVLLRDGRDVLDSIIDGLEKGGWESQDKHPELTKDKKLEFIRQSSRFWTKLMKVLMDTFDSHNKKLRLKIRYEDLRKNTLEELQKIYQFLEIDVKQKVLEELVQKYIFENLPETEKGKGKFKRSATPGKWEENFNDDEKEMMKKIMDEKLKELGYK